MKNAKKLLALLLALAMVFCIAACGKDADKEDKDKDEEIVDVVDDEDSGKATLDGKWKSELDMSDFISEMFAEQGMDLDVDAKLIAYFTLNLSKDGEAELSIDSDKTTKSFEKYLEAMVDPMVDMLYDAAAEEGLSKDEADEEFEASFGMGIKEYVEENLSQTVDFEDIFGSDEATFNGYYKAEDGKLYIVEDEEDLENLEDVDDYFEYTLKGKKLTFTAAGGEMDEMPFDVFPWVFTK